jgi:hypothetical protein
MGSAGGAAATYYYLNRKKEKKGEKTKWECVEVSHHKNVGAKIEEWQKDGWILYNYTAAGNPGAISHYLLFMRSE